MAVNLKKVAVHPLMVLPQKEEPTTGGAKKCPSELPGQPLGPLMRKLLLGK